MFVFLKICRGLFSCNISFEISFLAILLTIGNNAKEQISKQLLQEIKARQISNKLVFLTSRYTNVRARNRE